MQNNNTTTENFSGPHCWQYEIRQRNLPTDLEVARLTHAKIDTLRVCDFDFQYVPKEDKEGCQKIKEFITRHEWLGKMPHRPTHRFIASYKGKLAGVIVMATPNAFSNLLGKEMRDKEKLISRGACISWSPKNLASSLIMFSIKWMVKNTSYRFFTAYSDTQAHELGTIYQACNFTYLGQNSGARFEYFDPNEPDKGWFSDRNFRKTTSYKKYALELGIIWQADWGHRDKIFWDNIPELVSSQLKEAARNHQARCQRRKVPPKHKYAYFLGADKRETKKLKSKFLELNPDKQNLAYPKSRGPQFVGHSFERVFAPKLTERPTPCWPSSEAIVPTKKFYSIKEVASMYGINQWLIYHHIKADPTFPYVNVGVKKRFLIEPQKFEQWLTLRSHKNVNERHQLPSATELMEVGL